MLVAGRVQVLGAHPTKWTPPGPAGFPPSPSKLTSRGSCTSAASPPQIYDWLVGYNPQNGKNDHGKFQPCVQMYDVPSKN